MAGSSDPSFICTAMTRSAVSARICSSSSAPRVWCQMSTQQPAFGRSAASMSTFASAASSTLVKGRNSIAHQQAVGRGPVAQRGESRTQLGRVPSAGATAWKYRQPNSSAIS